MCDNLHVNPLSKRELKNPQKLQLLKKICADRKSCSEFAVDTLRNPVTGRKLVESSYIRRFIAEVCKVILPIINNAKKDKNIKSEAKKEIKNAILADDCMTSEKNPLQCTLYKTIKLKDHQKKVCNFVGSKQSKKGLILFHNVGSGKTISAITIVRCILQKKPNTNVFIISPTSVVWNFKKEMDKLHVKFGSNVKMYSHGTFIRKISTKGPEFARDSVIIVDEAHHFKTVKGKQSNLLMKATAIASKVFLLTATPIQNDVSEIANLYAMISGTEKDVKTLYSKFNLIDKQGIKDKDKEPLMKLFNGYISYYKNKDVSEYPSVSYHTATFKMTPTYYRMYTEIEKNTTEAQKKFGTKDLAIFINGIRRAVNSVDQEIPTPKVEWAVKHIKKSVKKKRKVLVYSNWLKSGINLIEEILSKKKIPYVEIKGSMSVNARREAVSKYNKGKVMVLFVSSAGGEGIDLKGTRSVIIMEPHWNNEKIRQVIGRAVRYQSHHGLPEKDRHVDVYNLVLTKPKREKGEVPCPSGQGTFSEGKRGGMLCIPTRASGDVAPCPSGCARKRLQSADQYLLMLSKQKDKKISTFYDILLRASI
jgi:SNF2 family DNA or RNA helicase